MVPIDNREVDKAHDIADHYGLDHQIPKLMEECAEMVVALTKYARRPERDDENPYYFDLREEIADALIMITQIAYLAGMEGDLPVTDKLNRQLKRISEEVKA